MKELSLEQVKMLPDGTRVFVACIGSEWCLDESELNSLNIKKSRDLYYVEEDDNNRISFPLDFDYKAENMDVVFMIEDGRSIYQDQFGNVFDINKIEDITAIINDTFASVNKVNQCDCILGNLESIVKKAYENRVLELKQ